MADFRASVYIALVVCSCSLQWVKAATDCTTALSGLEGCASFLTNPSVTPDQKTCCAPLETVLSTPSSLQCLCAQASGSASQALSNALLLPQACKLSINVSQANCTQSSPTSKTPATSTPASPSSSNSSATGSPSDGTMSASPFSSLLAVALLWSVVSLFV